MRHDPGLIASALGTDEIVFDFERDFAGRLVCMPMLARLKLDRSGVKLSLKQWNRLRIEQRRLLSVLPCDTVEDIDRYGETLLHWLREIDESAQRFQVDLAPAWENAYAMPSQIAAFAKEAGLAPPTLSDWQGLSPLQRFVLIKLSRPGHRNANFVPALIEFGVLSHWPDPTEPTGNLHVGR